MSVNSVEVHSLNKHVELFREAVVEPIDRFAVLRVQRATRQQKNEVVDVVLRKIGKALIESLDDHSVVLALVHSEHEATGCIVVGHGCNNLIDSVNAGLCGLLELAVDARLDNPLSVVVTSAALLSSSLMTPISKVVNEVLPVIPSMTS